MHLDDHCALAFAVFASAALGIEAETPRLVAANFGFARLGEQFANLIKSTGISRRVASRRLTNRRLVNLDYLINLRYAEDAFVFARVLARAIQPTP